MGRYYILPCILSQHLTILKEYIWNLLCLIWLSMISQNVDTTSEYLCLLEGFFCLLLSIRPFRFCRNLTSWLVTHWNFNSFFKNHCFAGQDLLPYSHCSFDIKVNVTQLYAPDQTMQIALASGTVHFIVQCFLILMDLWHLPESRLGVRWWWCVLGIFCVCVCLFPPSNWNRSGTM